LSGRVMPKMLFMSVVFPEPLGPRMAVMFPGRMSSWTSFSTDSFPNDLKRCCIEIMGMRFHKWLVVK
jgi:hypothetical protein